MRVPRGAFLRFFNEFSLSLSSVDTPRNPEKVEMAYEPSSLGIENLVVKALFIRGTIGIDFDNVTGVHRVAKKEACNLFHDPRPKPENITVLDCVFRPALKGFVVVVTDGSSRNSRSGMVRNHAT